MSSQHFPWSDDPRDRDLSAQPRRWRGRRAWAEYLEGHARRLYLSVTHGEAEAARRLSAKLVAGELPTPFSCWQVWRPGWSGLSAPKMAQAAIDILVDLDWLGEGTILTPGRKKTLYHLNPRVRELTDELA